MVGLMLDRHTHKEAVSFDRSCAARGKALSKASLSHSLLRSAVHPSSHTHTHTDECNERREPHLMISRISLSISCPVHSHGTFTWPCKQYLFIRRMQTQMTQETMTAESDMETSSSHTDTHTLLLAHPHTQVHDDTRW